MRTRLAIILITLLVSGILTLEANSRTGFFARADATNYVSAANIVGGLGTVASLLLALPQPRRRRNSTPNQIQEAQRSLQKQIARNIADEVEQLNLNYNVTQFRWVTSNIKQETTVESLAILLAEKSRACLVVTGESGTGKSAAALLLAQLILQYPHIDRIPILVDLSFWDPSCDLEDWMISQFRHEFDLPDEAFGSNAMAQLVVDADIIPIFDGIDNLSDTVKKKALGFVERWRGGSVIISTTMQEDDSFGRRRLT